MVFYSFKVIAMEIPKEWLNAKFAIHAVLMARKLLVKKHTVQLFSWNMYITMETAGREQNKRNKTREWTITLVAQSRLT